MIGLAVGLVAGVFQFWLLLKFTNHITSGNMSTSAVFLGLAQFLLPLAVLLCIGFLRRDELLYAGIGIVVPLITGAVVTLVRRNRQAKGGTHHE